MNPAFGPRDRLGDPLPEAIRCALALLLDAWNYAAACQRDAWDFAVEIAHLRGYGLTHSDLRWLLCKSLAKHGIELTKPADKVRLFQAPASLAFRNRTCFVLTRTGLSAARQMDHERSGADQPPPDDSQQNGGVADNSLVPRWDSGRRELRWDHQLVKRYRLRAPNQEVILAALEEEGWPAHIDDPLPHEPDQDPKQRLHDAIKNLNRHQVCHLLLFIGDGTGEGLRWRQRKPPFPAASPERGLQPAGIQRTY